MQTISVVLVLACAACVSTNAALLDSSLRLTPLPCPEAAQVFTDSSKVGKPYTEVALLNSAGDVAQAFLGTSANRKGRAIAIYIPSDTARVAAACKPQH